MYSDGSIFCIFRIHSKYFEGCFWQLRATKWRIWKNEYDSFGLSQGARTLNFWGLRSFSRRNQTNERRFLKSMSAAHTNKLNWHTVVTFQMWCFYIYNIWKQFSNMHHTTWRPRELTIDHHLIYHHLTIENVTLISYDSSANMLIILSHLHFRRNNDCFGLF